MSVPYGEGRGIPPPGNSREANGDGGARTAKTTNLLFSQYNFFFFFNCSVPFNRVFLKTHKWL